MTTTKAAHTPGPWLVSDVDHATVYVEHNGSEPGICSTDGSNFTPLGRLSEIEANTRLIAAAPEMLEALSGLLAVIRSVNPRAFSTYEGKPEDAQVMVDRAEAAIQKARGGE